tara:strand:- start:168 stop:1223 length:1056 start_codon:yes stop_codon:yes gene_type:complete
MYLEGSDQHRGWFHSSLLQSCGTRGKAPFESILSHGFVVDGKGLKMSKSAGNTISPEEILKKYGADILRIWVSASNYAEDLRIDHSILEQHADAYRKIRNTFRYLLGNLKDNYSSINYNKFETKNLPELEQFMLHKIAILNINFHKNFNSYNFHYLYKELLNFCTVDLSSFYFDIRKDTLYCDNETSIKREGCIKVLNVILDCLVKWFAPILTFTTEEIFKIIDKDNKSIHLENFPKIPDEWENDVLAKKWKELLQIRDYCNVNIEEIRAQKIIGSSLEAHVELELKEDQFNRYKSFDFAELFITSKVDLKVNNKNKNEINVNTFKAKGKKCPLCWKISEIKCARQNCSLK